MELDCIISPWRQIAPNMLPTLHVLIISYCGTYLTTKLKTIFFLILLNPGIMVNLFVMADEMGLGKTVQVVCFLNHIIKERFTAFPALVLAPKSILLQWEKVCRSLCNLVMLSLVFVRKGAGIYLLCNMVIFLFLDIPLHQF